MKRVIAMLLIALSFSINLYSMEVAGVKFPDSITAEKTRLDLNGVGTRTKFFMKMYIGALYLAKPNSSSEEIIDADEPMAIRLHITSSLITSERMEEAVREGFMNSTGENAGAISDDIEKFISVFKEKISDNDVYELVYTPGHGVEVFKNSVSRAVIKGLDFKKALFGIWLGDKPAQGSLKEEMLGRG